MQRLAIEPLRLFLAVSISAIPASFLLIVSTYPAISASKHMLLIPGVILAASWLLLMIGVSLLVIWRRSVRRIHCDLVGAVVVFVLPLTTIIAILSGAPLIFPDTAHAGVAVPLGAAVSIGLWAQPFGWFAGRMLWILGFSDAAAEDANTTARSWGDLARTRLLLTLCITPLMPAIADLALLLWYPTHGYSDLWQPDVWISCIIWTGGAGLIMATMGGIAFLYACSRGRHQSISRAICLTLGGCVALLLPGAAAVFGFALGMVLPVVKGMEAELFAPPPTADNIAFLLLVGALGTPLGLPGGWLLWRIGVAPAPTLQLESDTAIVFE